MSGMLNRLFRDLAIAQLFALLGQGGLVLPGQVCAQTTTAPAKSDLLPTTAVRDRRLEVAFESTVLLWEHQRTPEFVAQLQVIFDQDRDAWRQTANGDAISIRQSCLLFLQDHPTALADYRRIQDSAAKLALSRAKESGKNSDYLSVWRRFQVTSHGAEAGEWLIQRWLDDGAWDLAAGLALQSVTNNCPVGERFLRMGILSCQLAGWETEAQIIQSASKREETPNLPRASLALNSSRGRMPFEISPPILKPEWSGSLEAARKDLGFQRELEQWANEQRESDLPTAVGWAPVVVGQLVIFRDLDTIRAVEMSSGETVWRFESSTGLADLLNPAESRGAAIRYRSAIWDAAMANSLVSRLATDGQRIFAVNDSESLTFAGVYGLDANQMPQFDRRKVAQSELIALRAEDDVPDSRLLWRTSELAANDHRLSGHAFLGPPLTTTGCIYVISERDRQMCVTAMVGSSGEVLWQQAIAESERAVVEERGRSFRACIPVAARNSIICPTHMGQLVALDRISGQLLWAHHSLEHSAEAFPQRFRTLGTISQRRHGAFPATPLVVDDLVMYLPSQSEHLYCLERETGNVRWVVKNIAAEYLAAEHDGLVLVVGTQEIQALRTQDGQVVWRTPVNSVVSGMGLDAGSSYLLPLDRGEILNIDWQTGISRSFRHGSPAHAVGHLVANATQIISVGLDGVTAFPQSQALLKRLEHEQDSLSPAAISLARAEISLTVGDLDDAVAELEQAMQSSAPVDIRNRARATLVEVYFELAITGSAQAERWLTRLGQLELTPTERIRWLVAATALALSQQKSELLLEQSRLLAQCPPSGLVFNCPVDRDLVVSADVWMAILARSAKDVTTPQALNDLYRETARQFPDSQAAQVLALISPRSAEVIEHQQLAAQTAIAAQDFPQALVWLRRQQSSVTIPATSQSMLAQLFARIDWPAAAAAVMAESGRPSSNISPTDFGADSEQSRSWQAWLRQQPVTYPVDAVEIHSHPRQFLTVSDARLRSQDRAPYEDYQRQILAVSDDSPLEWLVRNSERGTEVAGFDKLSSRKVFEEVLQLGAGPPSAAVRLPVGFAVPFAMSGEVRAVTPLPGPDGHIAWTLKLPEWTERSGQAVCGPVTPRNCYLQWKNVLLAVDPLDGRVRWRRNNLESGSGLYGDARIGLLADDEIVFVLAADKRRYTVYDAVTGLELRTGTLDGPSYRSELGRCIVHITGEGNELRIRIWDPATDRWVLDDQLRSRQLQTRSNQGTLAWITPAGRLRLFAVDQQQLLVDVPLSDVDWNAITQLRVLPVNGRFLASLGRSSPSSSATQFHMPVPDRLIPGENFKDDVFAISADGREICWRRQMPQRTFLNITARELPFFVAATLVKDNRDANRRWMRVEAIDRESGVLLGVGDELPVDRLLHADYDGQAAKLTLIGRQTEIQLDFSPKVQWEARERAPL